LAFYFYEVVDNVGRVLKGNLEAENEAAVVERLRKQGYLVVSLRAARSPSQHSVLRISRRVGPGDLSLFCRQTAAMLDAGIPLVRSLFTLAKQTRNLALGEALKQVANSVEGGTSLSDALAAFPRVFPSLMVNVVRSGELSGALSRVFSRLAVQYDREKDLRNNIRSAVIYPAVVLLFAVAVMLVMMLGIVPLFLRFFPKDVPLPLMTSLVIGISNSLRSFWYLWILCLLIIYFGVRAFLQSPRGSSLWDRYKLRLPVVGRMFHLVVVARFARTLATLLGAGVPALQALEVAGEASGNKLVAATVRGVEEKVREGKNFAGPLEESEVFPPLLVQMVAVGEESGELPSLLERTADFYEAEVATATKGLTSIIEPLLIIIVGCMVGFLVISIYLPIFYTVTTLGR